MDFSAVIGKLNEFSPLKLAQSWDNVGVLVQPPDVRPVSKLLLTNDLTTAVMDEAEQKEVDLILSYHPPIFKALKSVTNAHWKERIVGRCLAKGISIYSPHTSYDALKGGVNDWLISAFGEGVVSPITQGTTNNRFSHKIEIFNLSPSSQQIFLSFLTESDLIPRNALVNKENDNAVSLFCKEQSLADIVAALLNQQKEAKYFISKCEKVPSSDMGDGRQLILSSSLTVEASVNLVKKHLGLSKIRLALKHGGTQRNVVKSVAVCAGSGSSVLRGVRSDLLLTGEMSHHDVLEATEGGSNVILVDHSNSERGFLSAVLRNKLQSELGPTVHVLVSERDADPLQIV